jgi:hypothetical protein
MVYGKAADIIFFEADCGIAKVCNSVGSRQGCSLGSLLYCAAIQPLILQLRKEFPDLLILAFCDDVHFVGDPAQASQAYKRYKFLYSSVLQGELRDDKGNIYSPNPIEDATKLASLPEGMPMTTTESAFWALPLAAMPFCESFSHDIVTSIIKDVEILARVPSLQAQHLIATKSIQHRVNHLLRNIPQEARLTFSKKSQLSMTPQS